MYTFPFDTCEIPNKTGIAQPYSVFFNVLILYSKQKIDIHFSYYFLSYYLNYFIHVLIQFIYNLEYK